MVLHRLKCSKFLTFLRFYCLFLFQIITFIVVQLLQKFNDANLDVIKTENLYNARRRERLLGVRLRDELKRRKDACFGFVLFLMDYLSGVKLQSNYAHQGCRLPGSRDSGKY